MENDNALIEKTADGVFKMLSDSGAMEKIYSQAKRMMWSVVEYKEMQMLYTCAMKEIKTKLEVLDTEFKVKHKRNPIASVTSRLKRTESLIEKLIKRGYPFSIESIHVKLGAVGFCINRLGTSQRLLPPSGSG